MSRDRFIKCVAVGDTCVGKTFLLTNTCTLYYGTSLFDTSSMVVNVDGNQVILGLWDTSGQEDYNRFRPLIYRGADVFILAFSLVDKTSYENVCQRWLPELKHYAPTVPIILVGTKQDLRENVDFLKLNPEYAPVSTAEIEEGLKRMTRFGVSAYIECSAKLQQNVKAVFEEAAKAAKGVPFIKCMTVGDGEVGKTCSLKSYTSNTFPTDGVPTVKSVAVNINGSQVYLGLWDTAEQDDNDIRPLSYREADVFVLTFSLVSQNSYESVYKKWLPELKLHAPMVPIILVGIKQDVREEVDFLEENPQFTPISTAQVDELKRMVGFGVSAYIECSTKSQQNVDAVFREAVKAVLQQEKKKRACSCSIL